MCLKGVLRYFKFFLVFPKVLQCLSEVFWCFFSKAVLRCCRRFQMPISIGCSEGGYLGRHEVPC